MIKQNVAIYLRLSEEDKNKADNDNSESIKNQRLLLLSEIDKHDDFVLFDEYCDEDISGAGSYRPEFERLIKDCEKGLIKVVLCKSQSRFSRDIEVIEKYLHNKFIEWNVRFISIADNADTFVDSNKKTRQINGLINEWYLEDISNNIKTAFKAKMLHGQLISPFAPYGYKIDSKDNNKLVIDPIARKIVKKIFNLYLEGYGYQKVADILNTEKIPSPSYYKYLNGCKLHIVSAKDRDKIKWSNAAIKKILTNEVYIGNLIQGKRTTVSYKNHKIRFKDKDMWIKKENTHEKIITKNVFNKVQQMIKNKSRSSKKTSTKHTLSGKVICLDCQGIMRKKSSGKHDYFICQTAEQDKNACPNNQGIRYDYVENVLTNRINGLVQLYTKIPTSLPFNIKVVNYFIQKIEISTSKSKMIITWCL